MLFDDKLYQDTVKAIFIDFSSTHLYLILIFMADNSDVVSKVLVLLLLHSFYLFAFFFKTDKDIKWEIG